MNQYCRYCAHCFQADEDEFRCSDHPKGDQPHWTRKQINHQNHCPNFVLSDLGDVETGKKYDPIEKERIIFKTKYEQLSILKRW